MPSFRTGTVTEILSERAGLQRVLVEGERAYVLTQLTGPVAPGDPVVMNTTAMDLGLGTGGWHVVHWNLARDAWRGPGGGHVMKLRYTSLQVDTGAGEESTSWNEARPAGGDLAADLGGTPVVAISLHSQLAPVAVAFAAESGARRLVYVMTDGGALPLALSDLVADLVAAGLGAGTVTCGHAFGGDLEGVNVPSALALAVGVLGAEAVVVGTGPGVVGTGTALGTTALEVAPVLDAAAALGGRPVATVRASSADARARHRGISHHTTMALRLVRSPVMVGVPRGSGLGVDDGRHEVREVMVPDIAGLLVAAGITVTTMGRTPAQDPLFFSCAGAAGVLAADLLRPDGR